MYTVRLYAEMGRLVSEVGCPTPQQGLRLLTERYSATQQLRFLYAVCYDSNGADVWRFDKYLGGGK